MVIGIFSDIHGNALAFESCLRQAEKLGVEKYYFLGDAVNYYSDSNEVLELLFSYNFNCVLGNHDNMVLNKSIPVDNKRAEIYGIRKTIENITKSSLQFINSWPDHLTIKSSIGNILLVHGSPRNHLEEYLYSDNDLAFLEQRTEAFIFCGHTHHPMDIVLNSGTRIINPGSVGLPRDIGNSFSFGILNLETTEYSLKRVMLDPKLIVNRYEYQVHPLVIKTLYKNRLWKK